MIGSSQYLKPSAGAQSPTLLSGLMAPKGSPSPPAAQPPAAPQGYSGQSTVQKPRYIGIEQTEGAVNNVLAQGYQQADPRYQVKQLDRAGFSRGKGQQFVAAQAGAQAQAEAAGKAADIRTQDEKANSAMRADYEKARELQAQNIAMVQHAMSQADWARGFAQRQNAQQLMLSLLNQSMTPAGQLQQFLNQPMTYTKVQ